MRLVLPTKRCPAGISQVYKPDPSLMEMEIPGPVSVRSSIPEIKASVRESLMTTETGKASFHGIEIDFSAVLSVLFRNS